ncbi:MAG: MBL fold metallo-hydrolase [Firmicutes bacterium]|jgi:flavorubredoxin|nr:MBL fold metallo-hydrolase [Bacillota bacterium]
MEPVVLKENIYWVGAIDWDMSYFHGPVYRTHRGTTYNSYLIIDEKITLVDTVFAPFAGEMLERISRIIDPSRIDYVVINHVETDHTGALPELMKLIPKAKIFCTARGKAGLLKHYYGDWDYVVVETGTELPLGKRTLSFIEAPMLHWPDSMFTYIREEALLMPNDAFGQHLASSFRFDDEVENKLIMEEASRYYANILYPLSKLVLKKLDEVNKLGIPISMIAPSHGVIWRENPGQIIEAYQRWAAGEWLPKAVMVYDTMWGSTAAMARAVAEGLAAENVDTKLIKVSIRDINNIFTELLEARLLVVGSPTVNRSYLSVLSPFLDELSGLKPVNRLGAAFGSYGWSKGAVKNIEAKLEAAGLTLAGEGLEQLWVPDAGELKSCYEWGRALGRAVKK